MIFRKPHRIKKKKPIWKNRFLWLFFLFLIIFLSFFYLVFFANFFQVKNIEISGNQNISTDILKENIENQIIKNLFFLKTKSIFLVDFKKIEKNLLKDFLLISQINLKKKFPNTLYIEIKERKPIAIFCQNENCFFIDKEGVIFEPTSLKKDYLILRNENLNLPPKLGEKIIDEKLISQILDVKEKILKYQKNNFKILIEEVVISSKEKIIFKTSDGWEIYFNFQNNIFWQLTKLKVVLENEISPENWKNLEYIDLRFGNFAPYKYR